MKKNQPSTTDDRNNVQPVFGPINIGKLRKAIEHSRKRLKPFRENRFHAIQQMVGSHFSDFGTSDKVPINMHALAVDTYVTRLVANNPSAMVETSYKQLKPMAATLELALDYLAGQIQLGKTLRAAVTEAIFSPIAVVKVGMTSSGIAEMEGEDFDLGQPFVELVTLDDWVHDTNARTWEKVMFEGDRYRLPYEYVMDSDFYDKKGKEKLKPDTPQGRRSDRDGGDKRGEEVTQGSNQEGEDFLEEIDLMDVWLPIQNKMITIPYCQHTDIALRVVDWEGPEHGPYHKLRFSDVPSSVMGLPPVNMWRDLSELLNMLWNKLARQAGRQKEIVTYRGEAKQDAETEKEAKDGEMVRVDNPEATKAVSFGGPNQVNLAMVIQTKQLISQMAGNLDLLAGLSADSGTLGQDELLNRSSSMKMNQYQDRVADFTQGIMRDLAFYLFYDDMIQLPLVKRPKGTSIDIPLTLTAETREGTYLDYNIKIRPYSMQMRTPAQRLAAIEKVFQTYIAPAMPILAQQGTTVNYQSLLRLVAKLLDINDLDDILTFGEPQQGVSGPVGEAPGKVATTNRTYTRVNKPGATQQGQDAVMMQNLLGGNPQPAQMASMGRPVG